MFGNKTKSHIKAAITARETQNPIFGLTKDVSLHCDLGTRQRPNSFRELVKRYNPQSVPRLWLILGPLLNIAT
jgi:hypothetical protein